MIGTYFYDGQGLGNQMWSYYALRLIAKRLKCPFSVFGMKNFKGFDFILIRPGELISHPAKTMPSKSLFPPFEKYFSERQIIHTLEYCDIRGFDSRCLEITPNTLIDGYFQSEELVKMVQHDISEFFQIKDIQDLNYLTSDDICVLNVRGGEYVRNKRLTLNKKYWHNAMKHIRMRKGVKKFVIVTDDPVYAKGLLPNLPVLEQNMHSDFSALTKAKNVIISNSSFAYFPLRFNKQNPYIIAPKYWARHNVSDGYWACRSNIYSDYNYIDRNGCVTDGAVCSIEADDFLRQCTSPLLSVEHSYVTRHPSRIKSFLRNRIVSYD